MKNKVLNNLFWKFLERCGAQAVPFVVSLILARILDTETYGIIAIITVFTSILGVFVDCGLGSAIVQMKDADDLDFSSLFFFNVFISVFLYLIVFVLAPILSSFYDMPELTGLTRVISLSLIISGFSCVQTNYAIKKLQFRRFFFSTLAGTIVAAAVGITMALAGFGVWALVAQTLANSAVNTIVLWFTVRYRPRLRFSLERLKRMLPFGTSILISGLVNSVYSKIHQMAVGKVYSADTLAFYNKGITFPYTVSENINKTIDSVLFPVMSELQDSKERIRDVMASSIKMSSYIMMPMMMGIAVCAEPIVRLVLTEKWLPCVPFLRIFCVIYACNPAFSANGNALKAFGLGEKVFKVEIMKTVIGLVLMAATLFINVYAVAAVQLLETLLCLMINAAPLKKLLDYGFGKQLKDMLPQMILTIIMGAAVYAVSFISLGDLAMLAIQIPLGVVIYLIGSVIMKIDSFTFLVSLMKQRLHSGKNNSGESINA